MRIVVCIRQSTSGEINPFDACAYEEALRIHGAEVILLSMCPQKSADFFLGLTRLGAKKAILLSDKAFAGSDTLATAYTLSLAIKKLNPDLIFCGRQTVDGDTGQTGPALSVITGYSLITNVLSLSMLDGKVTCNTRDGEYTSSLPALLTIERINNLRLPSIRSRLGEVEIWSAEDLDADISRCGLPGSPTRVMKTFENTEGRRHCTFITLSELEGAIISGLQKNENRIPCEPCENKLKRVLCVGEAPLAFAESVSDDISVLEIDAPHKMAEKIRIFDPSAVLWGSDLESKRIAPQVAAILRTGLCADCTRLETDGGDLFMYRPAFSGNIIAKIRCETRPAMATVRTAEKEVSDVIFGLGFGAKDNINEVKALAEKYNADICASRKLVDNDCAPYEQQVGMTGKTVSPSVYVAVGISGAVHHLAGIRRAGTIIAINSDKKAPIFEYADYGIVCDVSDLSEML